MKFLHGQLSKSIYSLNTLKNYLDKDCLKLVYYAHFNSHINYCYNLFSMATKKSFNPIVILQNKSIKSNFSVLPSKILLPFRYSILFFLFNLLAIFVQ